MKPGAIHEIESLVPFADDAPREIVLVLHDDDAFLYVSNQVLVVPLTLPPDPIRGHPLVKIAPTPQNGLKKPMVAVLDRLHNVDRIRIGKCVGEIDRSTMIDVYRVLDRMIGRNAAPPTSRGSGDTRHTEL